MDCNSGCSSCSTSIPCPCPTQGNPSIDSLEKVLSCYWQNHQQLDVERVWYSSLDSVEHAVHEAALALADENVDLDHVPDRIPLTELATAKQRLRDAVPLFREAENFDGLLGITTACLEDLGGMNEELIFLTALRIGMQAGLEPESIYLMSSTREGAAQLIDLGESERALDRGRLPELFQHPDLSASFIQGCFTVCRNQLQWLRKSGCFSGS